MDSKETGFDLRLTEGSNVPMLFVHSFSKNLNGGASLGSSVVTKSACQCRRHGFDPWSGKIPHAIRHLSPCTTTAEPALYRVWELQLWKWVHPRARAPQQEKPLRWEACTLQLERSSHSLQLERSQCSNKDPAQLKMNKQIKLLKKKKT